MNTCKELLTLALPYVEDQEWGGHDELCPASMELLTGDNNCTCGRPELARRIRAAIEDKPLLETTES